MQNHSAPSGAREESTRAQALATVRAGEALEMSDAPTGEVTAEVKGDGEKVPDYGPCFNFF